MQTHKQITNYTNYAVENKLTQWFVYKWVKPTQQKPPSDDFKVTTPENSLLSKQAVTSKEISVLYTNL